MERPCLVVMAAGLGSRFGGLKQITPVDAAGHSILDFSLYDAWRAGFRDVAFIIKRDMEASFRDRLGRRMEDRFDVHYVHQELEMLPEGFSVPEGRVKPWGTGHAVACCRGTVTGPFAVINSDDFYGPTAYSAIYDFLAGNRDARTYAMVGYKLRNTLTGNGTVSRGICRVENGFLAGVTERTRIERRGRDAACTEDGETWLPLSGDAVTSLNLWGFTNGVLDALWGGFPAFLRENLPTNPLKCEYFLPSVVDQQLSRGEAAVRVLHTDEVWHGITYREDLQEVVSAVAELTAAGVYPKELWSHD